MWYDIISWPSMIKCIALKLLFTVYSHRALDARVLLNVGSASQRGYCFEITLQRHMNCSFVTLAALVCILYPTAEVMLFEHIIHTYYISLEMFAI